MQGINFTRIIFRSIDKLLDLPQNPASLEKKLGDVRCEQNIVYSEKYPDMATRNTKATIIPILALSNIETQSTPISVWCGTRKRTPLSAYGIRLSWSAWSISLQLGGGSSTRAHRLL